MTSFLRTVYDSAPAMIEIPAELRQQRVEVIIISLEREPVLPAGSPEVQAGAPAVVDDRGWPAGFFEATSGQWQGAPLVREQPASYEVREELD